MKRMLAVLALASFGLMAAPPTTAHKTEEPTQQTPVKKSKKTHKSKKGTETKSETPTSPAKS
jgi:uncharacterized iron-regulated membrane protein